MTKIAILVLAAGEARRFGGRKQLVEVNGSPMLYHVINAVRPLSPHDLYVVLGAFADDIVPVLDDAIHVIRNRDWQTGIAGSIACGVSHLVACNKYDGVLIVLGDQVALKTEDYGRILKSFEHNAVSVADYGDTVGPPALFPKRYMNTLTGLRGDYGAKKILLQGDRPIRRVPMQRAAIDIDTREDLRSISQNDASGPA